MAFADLFADVSGGWERFGQTGSDGPFENKDLFGDHNPFEEALKSSDSGNFEDGTQVPEEVPPPVEPAVSDLVPSQAPAGGGGQGLEKLAESPQGPFDFLLVGEFSAGQEERVFRGVRDSLGRFLLENATRYTLAKGFLQFSEGERVLTTDLNGDGVVDLVVVRDESGTNVVQVFEGTGGIRFNRTASFSVSEKVVGISAFELTGDGQEDLVLLSAGVPRLVVYEQAGSEFKYAKELALDVLPGLLIESKDSQGRPVLNVLNSAFTQVVTLKSGTPDVFYPGPSTILDKFNTLAMDGVDPSQESSEFLYLDYGGRITLIEKTFDGISFLGSFDAADTAPLVILGDYLDSGGRQLLFAPTQ